MPRWRGAAPIQRSIWAGDKQTGVTIMQMDIGLDTGDMLSVATLPIENTDTSASMYEKLAELGPTALTQCLVDIANNQISPQKQNDDEASYAKKLTKEEAKIDWNHDAEASSVAFALNPWPMSYFSIEESDSKQSNVKVWQSRVETTLTAHTPGKIIQADKTGVFILQPEKIF